MALWHLGGTARPAAAGRTGGGPWLEFLPAASAPGGSRIVALAWSPDGRLLAAASPDFSGLLLWDAASGAYQRLGAGFSPLRLLRWSPDGSYLLAGGCESVQLSPYPCVFLHAFA